MIKTGTRLLLMLIAVLLMGTSFTGTSALAHEQKGGHGGYWRDPLFGVLRKLNFTEDQKAQVAAILKSNETEAKSIATGLANARVQLLKATLSGADVSAACSEVANYELQAAQLRADIFSQIKKILSPAQQTIIQNMQNEMAQNVNALVTERFERLDKWISQHSK